jgi:hypothetical protein
MHPHYVDCPVFYIYQRKESGIVQAGRVLFVIIVGKSLEVKLGPGQLLTDQLS